MRTNIDVLESIFKPVRGEGIFRLLSKEMDVDLIENFVHDKISSLIAQLQIIKYSRSGEFNFKFRRLKEISYISKNKLLPFLNNFPYSDLECDPTEVDKAIRVLSDSIELIDSGIELLGGKSRKKLPTYFILSQFPPEGCFKFQYQAFFLALKKGYISDEFSLEDFRNLFVHVEVRKKIIWIGGKGELKYLVYLLKKNNIIENKNHNSVAGQLFTFKDCEVGNLNDKPSLNTRSKERIQKLLLKFVPRAELY